MTVLAYFGSFLAAEEAKNPLHASSETVAKWRQHAVRHVHPLGTGEPQGDRDQLVARRWQIPIEEYDNLYKQFNPVEVQCRPMGKNRPKTPG